MVDRVNRISDVTNLILSDPRCSCSRRARDMIGAKLLKVETEVNKNQGGQCKNRPSHQYLILGDAFDPQVQQAAAVATNHQAEVPAVREDRTEAIKGPPDHLDPSAISAARARKVPRGLQKSPAVDSGRCRQNSSSNPLLMMVQKANS